MSLLIYSPRCKHSMDVIEYINKHQQLKQLVNYHNVNTQGIPPNYRNKINRVPTMLTKNGKILVGTEIKNWLDSLLPAKEVSHGSIGAFGCVLGDAERARRLKERPGRVHRSRSEGNAVHWGEVGWEADNKACERGWAGNEFILQNTSGEVETSMRYKDKEVGVILGSVQQSSSH